MSDSQSAQQLYDAGRSAFEQGHWIAAEPLLQSAISLEPLHASALHLLGKLRQRQGRVKEALQWQQRSCEVDPALGWNWFSAGELLAAELRWGEALSHFEQAFAALPHEGWIREQMQQMRMRMLFQGEELRGGLGPHAYRFWIQHHEVRCAPSPQPSSVPFWLLDGDAWRALHTTAPLQPLFAPLGQSPWPLEGWLVLVSPGVRLRQGALAALEAFLQQQSSPADVLYGDEDRFDQTGQRSHPWFKPAWLEETFWSSPWLENCSLWRVSWLRDQQVPLPPSDGVGRFLWMLKALERQPRLQGWPQILSHCSPQSNSNPKDQEQKALLLREHLKQQGELIARVTPNANLENCFSLHWSLPDRWSCSVIIPTRDRSDLLSVCLESLWAYTAKVRTRGLQLELIVVDNGSLEPAMERLLQIWQKRLGADFVVLRDQGSFNWSRLNNRAASHARGDLLLLLNNDVEALQPGWLEAMAAQAFRPLVGAVGALLLYPDNTLQHGGVVVGLDGHAEHAYRGLPLDHRVHRGRSQLLSRWDAVTGACLMIRKSLLETLGGFDEALPVEGNDVDLCLRLEELGYRQVIPPEAILLHHESRSRDARFSTTEAAAVRHLQRRWGSRLQSPGPCWPAQSDGIHSDGRPEGLEQCP